MLRWRRDLTERTRCHRTLDTARGTGDAHEVDSCNCAMQPRVDLRITLSWHVHGLENSAGQVVRCS